jgi:uncharacterized membrane protein YbaN (DUF454 family)
MTRQPARAAATQASDESAEGQESGRLEIELDTRTGVGRVVDPRLFQPARREYARCLLEALCEHEGVRKAEVDLASSSCRVEYDLDVSSRKAMGDILVDAVYAASARSRKTPWWKRSPTWSSLTAYRSSGTLLLWEKYTGNSGDVRLVHPGSALEREAATQLADALAGIEGVDRCDVSLWSHKITIHFAPEAAAASRRTVSRLERVLEGREQLHFAPASGAKGHAADGRAVAPSAWGRLKYGALAGGAFSLTLVGLLIPGIPTVPFLLATSYYLARSSPRLNDRLRRTTFFGPILQDWEGQAGLGHASKGKLIALTGTIVVATLALAPLTPLALVVILGLSSLSVLGIARMPGVAENALSDGRATGRSPLPLPAP